MGRPRGSVNKKHTFLERFWEKVLVQGEDECWPWLAGQQDGYGCFMVGGPKHWNPMAHVVVWELSSGEEVPSGCDVDHLCHNRLCQNPRHLQVLSKAEHGRRHAIQRWEAARERS